MNYVSGFFEVDIMDILTSAPENQRTRVETRQTQAGPSSSSRQPFELEAA
jgi:hypothetical protein